MTILQTIYAALNWNLRVNENFDTLSALALGGKRQLVTTGLTWGFYGGLDNGNTVADSQVTLTDNADNYVVKLRSSGAVSVSTSTANGLSAKYAKLYKVTTLSRQVTAVVDQRTDANGLFSAPIGRQALYIPASRITPSASGGCAALAGVASAANQPDIVSLDFDTTTQEFAQFALTMPKRWDGGSVTFKPIWSHAATTTNFGVVWQLQGLAVSDNEAIAQAYGTAVTSTDTGGTTNNLYTGPESAAIAIAGSPAAEDTVFFRVARVPANGSDTLAIDARLHGLIVYINTDAPTDA